MTWKGQRTTPSIVDALRQHLDAAERGHAPCLQHHDLRRELAQFGGVMADIDHRNAFVAQPHQVGQDLDLAALVERSQRFVQQQQARLRQQRPAERDALALAAGQLAGTAVEQMADIEQVGDALLLRGIPARRFMRRP